MSDSNSDLRVRILAAAKRCYLTDGISVTGMRDVAATANIARSTLYRYFPGRDDLLVATIQAEMEGLNARIRKKIARYHEPADLLVEGLIVAVREVPRNPLLRAVFTSDEDSRARRVIWRSDVIVAFGEELMADVIGPASEAGTLQDAVSPELLVEWVYRLLLSFLTLPSNWTGNERELRATLHALRVPVMLR